MGIIISRDGKRDSHKKDHGKKQLSQVQSSKTFVVEYQLWSIPCVDQHYQYTWYLVADVTVIQNIFQKLDGSR